MDFCALEASCAAGGVWNDAAAASTPAVAASAGRTGSAVALRSCTAAGFAGRRRSGGLTRAGGGLDWRTVVAWR